MGTNTNPKPLGLGAGGGFIFFKIWVVLKADFPFCEDYFVISGWKENLANTIKIYFCLGQIDVAGGIYY